MTRRSWLSLLPLLLGSSAALAQEPVATVRVVPGARYGAGRLHRFFLGNHYRTLWTTSIEVELLDLQHFAGGLTATERGGGQQTRSLRLVAADGREFAFRSVDKDPAAILPSELRGTVANDVVQDQISAAHPAGALVVPPILAAAGVPHSTPRLVVLPDDASLGEFQEEFGGMLGLFEERPDDDAPSTIVPGAQRVVSSDNIFRRVEESPDDQVDARVLLAARLMDVLLGDWDRHRDQWRWATVDTAAPRRWLPIPRDRDQAFVRFDGFLLVLGRGQAPQLVNFGPDYPAMVGITWNGRELDRRFLVGLERAVWDSTALALQALITDQVIEAGVARLPAAYHPLDSARLTKALRSRRDKLPQAAGAFYRLLAREVDVHATDVAEDLDVEPVGARALRVTIRRRGDSVPHFRRVFHDGETGEVRVYLHGGADRVRVSGSGTGGIRLRVIGGGGKDDFRSTDAGGGARFYDADGVDPAPNVHVNRRSYSTGPRPTPTALPPRDWGSAWLPFAWARLGPTVGLLAGAGVTFTDYGFRQQPYASRHTIRAGWATGLQEPVVQYLGVLHGENRRAYFRLLARYSGIEVANFHGFGNETRSNRFTDFYRTDQRIATLEPAVVLPLGQAEFSIAPRLMYSTTNFHGGRLIDQARPYGSGNFGTIGVQLGARVDTRDLAAFPTRGVLLDATVTGIPALWDARQAFGSVEGSATTYLPVPLPLQPVLALRAGGKHTEGEIPFQEAAYLGGAGTVRLARENRYAGDAAVWGNAELRLRLGNFRFIMPGEMGVFGLADGGRVFLEGEDSDRWHSAVGGGLWFAFIGRGNTVSAAWAQSGGQGRLYVQAGFGL